MLLIEITINGTVHRVSVEGHALTHYWDPYVVAFDPPRFEIPYTWGGYAAPRFGAISFSPELFASDWPPPVSCAITVKYSDTDEASAETLISGTAHLVKISLIEVKYDIYGPSYATTTPNGQAFNDTLVNVAAYFCGASHLNLTLDTSKARSPSPNVKFTTNFESLDIDLFSEVAAFYSHFFYISGSTLYLVDMFADNGSRDITEFDFFFGSYYEYRPPVAVAHANDNTGTEIATRTSGYPYGQELYLNSYHDTAANAEDCLDDILTLTHKPRMRLMIPWEGNTPVLGEAFNWTDESMQGPSVASIRVRSLQYRFMGQREEIIVEGEGSLT